MGLFKKKFCPICNIKINSSNKSIAAFNGDTICCDCERKISNYYGNKKSKSKIYLEDLRKIVNDDSKNENNISFFSPFTSTEKEVNELDRKYGKYNKKHFDLINDLNQYYSVSKYQTEINDPVKKLIDLCNEDIKIAPYVLKWHKEYWKLYDEDVNPEYPSFKYLGRTYEKFYGIKSALEIYDKGAKLNINDGTKGSCKGRIAYLLKKYNKENKTNIQYDYEKYVFYDDNTGEVINLSDL